MSGSGNGRGSISSDGGGESSEIEPTLEIVSKADLPAVVIDPSSGRIQDSNERFEELFGWPRAALRRKTYRDLVRQDRHREVRDFLSVLSFGGSQPPLRILLKDVEEEMHPTTWVGIPTILGKPLDPIAIVTRPTGGPVGKPVGPPASLVQTDDEGLDRIPPRQRVRDPRGAAEKSRSLWERKW